MIPRARSQVQAICIVLQLHYHNTVRRYDYISLITSHGTHTLNFAFVLFLHPFGVIFSSCPPASKPASTTGEEPATRRHVAKY